MILLNFSAYGFRNLVEQTLSFEKGLQVFVGLNAQGKTNFLEAIYTLLAGRSFRPVEDSDMVQDGALGFRLSGKAERKDGEVRLTLVYNKAKREKTVEANAQPLKRIIDLWGEAKAVAFSPQDVQLIKGPPSLRRQFINKFLGQSSSLYRHNLLRFSLALKQRNALLKKISRGEKEESLNAWEETFVSFGQKVIEERAEKIERLSFKVGYLFEQIGIGGGRVTIKYRPSSQNLNKDINLYRFKEVFQGISLFGPHLDELEIFLNGKEAKFYASEGEMRSISLAIKLAEWESIKEETGEEPLLVLDDALSDLDEKRQVALLSLVSSYPQVFLSLVSLKFLPDPFLNKAEVYHVQAGQARKGA